MKKFKSLKNLILLIALFLTAIVFIAAGGESLDLSVEIESNVSANTDEFTIGNEAGATYYSDITAGSAFTVYKNHNANYEEIPSFDLIVFADNDDAALSGFSGTSIEYTLSGGYCTVFKGIDISGLSSRALTVTCTDTTMQAVIAAHNSLENVYITSFYDLKTLNNETYFNNMSEISIYSGIYYNVYLLEDVTVNKDFVFTVPAHFNLLYSDLTLDSNMTIKHSFGGFFAIENIPVAEGGKIIISDSYTLTINTPNAYYYGVDYVLSGNTTNVITPTASFIKHSENVDFTLSTNSAYLGYLLDDALNYIANYLPDYAYGDLTFYTHYQTFDVAITYSSSDTGAITDLGAVTRTADNQSVTLTITVTFTGDVFDGATVTDTLDKIITVVGTGDSAVSGVVTNVLEEYISNLYTITSGEIQSIEPFDVKELITELLLATNKTEITLAVGGNSGTMLAYLINDTVSGGNPVFDYEQTTFTTCDFSSSSGDLYVDFGNGNTLLTSSSKVMVKPSSHILDGSSLTLTASLTTGAVVSSGTASYTLSGMTKAETQEYLQSFLHKPYVKGVDDGTDANDVYVMTVKEDGLYYGDAQSLNSTLGITGISYKIRPILTSNIESLTAAQIETLYNSTATADTAYETNFDLTLINTDGVFSLMSEPSIPTGTSLILCGKCDYADGTSYYYAKEIIISIGSTGGDDYTEYMNDTYAEYFKSLTNRRLIDSTADAAGVSGTAHRFSASYEGVYIDMVIENSTEEVLPNIEIGDYCTIVKTGTYYQINIDINSIPTVNSTVDIKVYVYVPGEGETGRTAGNTKDELSYYFIIPGIYRCIEEEYVSQDINEYIETFHDRTLYDYIIGLEDNNGVKIYESYNGYLLVDGAVADNNELDLSSLKSNYTSSTSGLNLSGVQYLTGTRSFVFNNYSDDGAGNLYIDGSMPACYVDSNVGLKPFSLIGDNTLTSLSFVNCNITSEMLADYLATQRSLEEVDLSYNLLTSLEYNGGEVFYRSLKTLNVASQSNLTSITGVERMHELTELDISNNKVADFRPLKEMDVLQTVYLYGNTTLTEYTANGVTVSGGTPSPMNAATIGELSIPELIALLGKGITVYAKDATTPLQIGSGVDNISSMENVLSLMLNSIVVSDTYSTETTFTNALADIVGNYYVNNSSNNGAGQPYYEVSSFYSFNNGNERNIILCVRYYDGSAFLSDCVYKLFTVNIE